MKIKKVVWICILLILIPISLSIGTYQETASVARIVGESPAEMIRQMQRDSVELKGATFYPSRDDPYYLSNDKESVLNNQFGYANVETPMYSWSFDSFENDLEDMNKNELLILEADGGVDPLNMKSGLSIIEPADARGWQDDFEEKNPLFLLDSSYGGVYLPKEDTFVSRLVRDSTIIAPTSFNTEQFVTSTVCMLYDDKTVGQLFRDARNFHYNGGSSSTSDNYIGLVLQSYALYGNPLQRIDMPEYERRSIRRYCKNFLQNLAGDIEFLGYAGNYSRFRKHLVFTIDSYNLVEEGNFTVINSSNTFQNLEYGELVLPKAVRTTYFPKSTIITNVSLDAAYDYVYIEVDDLPSYEFGYVNRSCYYENKSVEVLFYNGYEGDSQKVVATIYPVEVINCTNGSFRLFKRFNYSIDYIAVSPVLVREVISPAQKTVNEQIDVEVELMNMINGTVNGYLVIFDDNNSKIYEEEINTNVTKYNLSFFAPPIEGNQKYGVEFVYDNETVSYKEFFIDINVMDVIAEIPVTAEQNENIKVDFYSYYGGQFPLKVDYYLKKDFTILDNGTIQRNINNGSNIENIQLTNLLREDGSYTLTLEMFYLNQKRSVTYLIVTNNPPLLYIYREEDYWETELINLSFIALDADNDTISVTIDDPRFSKEGNSFVWQTDYYDNGKYYVTIRASDGLLEGMQNISIKVLELNERYNITLYEGWNLISIPLPLNQSIEDVFSSVMDRIEKIYSYEEAKWKGYIPFSGDNTLLRINSSYGYWIKVNESFNAEVLIIPERNITYPMEEGWNLMGYIADDEEEIGSALWGINYTRILGYINGTWVSNDKRRSSSLNSLKSFTPGYGYWVNVEKCNTWLLDFETGLFIEANLCRRGGGPVK